MEYKLLFTYTGANDICRVFDYLRNVWMSFEECAFLYGEGAARCAMFNPGKIIESDAGNSAKRINS